MLRAPDLVGCALDDRYELLAVLGEGAFGRVYSGRDRRLERPVAVKVIKPWWAEDSEWVERFQREAQLLARVDDPGIVQIYDFGHAEEGPYYVAELVDGESLAERLQRGPLPAAESRVVAEKLARALGSAHSRGIVHCDVKPANVLLAADGRVKVGDFGVARLAGGTSGGVSVTVAGTPRYMSPEQARGRPTTAATDVYSAGIVLYEMLTGEPPFTSGSAVELGLRHLQDAPPALPAHVPPALAAVVMRALAKDPAERYADGAALAAALAGADPSAVSSRAAPAGARSPSTDVGSQAGAATAVIGTPETDRAPSIDAVAARVPRAAPTRVLARDALPASRVRSANRRENHRTPGRRRVAMLAAALTVALGALLVLLLTGAGAKVTVPDLRGLPAAGVQARATRTHVHPVFSRRYSDAAVGIATAQTPTPGARVSAGSTVEVVLSAGPPPVPVPDVVGLASASAEGLLANAGLRYRVTLVAAPGSNASAVLGQSPTAAATAPSGSTVALTVAEPPRWRVLTTFSGVDDGQSAPFEIRGSRWRVSYSMSYTGTCLLLVTCLGPSAQARDLRRGSSFGGFELNEGSSQTHAFDAGPGLYRVEVSGGEDSAQWAMTVEDYY
ncbi:MAG TPA: protein kinase [Solirubrobacteraceae bacterium]|nr:protein kinase [Solirubrobacteraceae bacterium]